METNIEKDQLESLSLRSRNIVERIGGVKKLIIYYYKNLDFIGLRSCGAKSNKELINFCKIIISELESNKEYQEIESSPIIKKIRLYNEYKENLPLRAQNTLQDIEKDYRFFNIDEAEEYLDLLTNLKIDFNIRHAGKKTISDLKEFSKTIREVYEENSIFTLNTVYTSNLLSHFEDEYSSLKASLSQRAQNILSELEKNFDGNSLDVIKQLLSNEIDFYNIKNVGDKTVEELKKFTSQLCNYVESNKENPYTPTYRSLKNFFPQNCNEELLNNLIEEDSKCNFLKTAILAIYYGIGLKPLEKVVCNKLYFYSEEYCFNTEDLSKQTLKSNERIRQIKKNLESEYLFSVIQKINKSICGEFIGWLIDERQNNFIILKEYSFEDILGENINPSRNLITNFLGEFLKAEHTDLNKIIKKNAQTLKALKYSSATIFIKNEFLQEKKIEQFLIWISSEIIGFELSRFDYNMNVLISRFFKEEDIQITEEDQRNLAVIIEEIRADFTGTSIEKKGLKIEDRNYVIELIRQCILSAGRPLKTDQIVKHLEEKFVEKTKEQVLVILNHAKNEFMPFGHGAWALTEWKDIGLVGGSIREITIHLLEESQIPLHITQIFDYISKFRTATVQSVLSNLRAEETKAFIFLNCCFIGLSSKKYEKEWHQITKAIGPHFSEFEISNARNKAPNNMVDFIANKFKLPPIHVQYVLAQKNILLEI